MTKFTATDYISAFHKLRIVPHHLMMLQENYYAPNRTLTATTMAKALGYYKYTAANLHYGKLASLVAEELGWIPVPEFKLEVLVDFEKRDGEWHWIMKPEVAEAIERLGWVDDKQLKTPEEIDEEVPIFEGATKRVSVNAYERSSAARARCILHYGYKCTVCDVVLSDVYGEIAQGFIHVHHLKQLSEINAEYQVDPIRDLRPVCPTCHAIIHLRKPPYSIEEVRELIKDQPAWQGGNMTLIREERPEDIGAIRKINEEAFGQPAEADIVDRLRENSEDILSLVAVEDGEVVGHILFSPATIEGDEEDAEVAGMGLAPMAVLPELQGHEIGTRLIRTGIEILRERGCPFIIVLGYPEYYPRFGFERAFVHGIRSQWDEVPDEAFMVLILDRSAMSGISGVARYRSEFDEAM